MDHEAVVKQVLQLRAERKVFSAAVKAEEERMDAIEADLEGRLLKVLLDAKVKSMRVDGGTFYIEKKTRATCTDWNAYRAWMVENDALDGVEKRVGQLFITEYMADNNDELPDGITVQQENVVVVRKGK